MKKQTYLIYYSAGCYGTFIEWVCQHFYNNLVLDEYPFTETGSSHKYNGNLLHPAPKIIEYIESERTFKFVRVISSIFEEVNSAEKVENNLWKTVVQEDLTFLNQHFNKIIVLHPSNDSQLWLNNNVLDKCFITDKEFEIVYEPYGYTKEFLSATFLRDPDKKLKDIIKKELTFDKAQYWGKKTIDELEHWELRELLSMYWFERDKDFYSCWEPMGHEFSNNLFVSIDELKNSTPEILEKILHFFDIQNYNRSDLQEISTNWKSVQEHKNKDQHINEIISHILLNKSYDWKNINLSILDEAYIQKKLKEQNIEIKCYNLNKFPSNTKTFNNFLIR
jgi:hypothetical protein